MPIISNFPGGSGTGNGLALNAVSDISVLVSSGKVHVSWTDPSDIEIDGTVYAEWAGTLLVRKAGSMPASRRDGTIVLDSVTRDAYSSSYFTESGLTDGVTYYYKFYPYTTDGVYTDSEDDEFTATPTAEVDGIDEWLVTDISLVKDSSTAFTAIWSDPASTITSNNVTLATWYSTTILVTTDDYASSIDDTTNVVSSYTSLSRNLYQTTGLAFSGLETGATYYVAFFPQTTDGYVNSDTSQRASINLNREATTVPTQSRTLTYNGTEQSPSWDNYDSDALTIGGTVSATDAGTYTATFTPTEDYEWEDGTRSTIEVNWVIDYAYFDKPYQSTTLTYNEAVQTPTWENYDSSAMTISGTTSATNAGTYTTIFTLNDPNYLWSDGTSDAISVEWTIDKATGTMSLSATSLELNPTALTGTITVTRSGDGTISVTSSDTSVAAVSLSGTTVTVTAVSSGSATITVSVAASTNYTAPSSMSCSVAVLILSTTLAENTPGGIQVAAQVGVAEDYWSVGDMIDIELNGTVGAYTFSEETYYAYIIGFDHNSDIEGTNTIHFQMAMDSDGTSIAFVDSHYAASYTSDSFHMNSSSTNSGGWESSYMRSTICPAFLSTMPSDWQSVISACTKYTDNSGGSGSSTLSHVTSTSDSIWLVAPLEVDSTSSCPNSYEGNYQEQYDYYANGNSAIKYKHTDTDTYCNWFSRSPYAGQSTMFCYYSSSNGCFSGYAARWSIGFSPCFVVA